ncbi:hypothetical protein DRQ09_10275, partial [candidate division KSB1 bacterium]
MLDKKRELATNKLLEVLRSGTAIDEEDIAEVETVETVKKPDEIEIEEVSEKKNFLFLIGENLVSKIKSAITTQKGILALDIGSNSVKYVIFRKIGGEIVLTDSGCKNFNVYDKSPQGIKEARISAISELITKDMVENNNIITSIYGPNVSIRRITMPKVNKKELHDAILWNAKKDLPFSPETALIDYYVVGEIEEKGVPKLEVFVGAADNSVVEEHLNILKSLDIIPYKIIAVPLAVFNCYVNIFRNSKIEDGAIIDIGAENSYIVFINEGKLQFAREISTGGNDITKEMIGSISTSSGIIKIDYRKAEELKVKYGIPDESSFIQTPDGIPLSQISSLMRPVIERILNQIQRSLDYFRNKFPYNDPDIIYLSGGTSLLKNFDTFLSEGLGKEVRIFDPKKYIKVSETIPEEHIFKKSSPLFAVAIGMALEPKERLNLLPQELKIIPLLKLQKKIIKLAAIFLFLILSTASALAYLNFKKSSDELKNIRLNQGKLGSFFQQYSELENKKKIEEQNIKRFL